MRKPSRVRLRIIRSRAVGSSSMTSTCLPARRAATRSWSPSALALPAAEALAAHVVRETVKRSGIDPARIDDVVFAQSYANSEVPCVGRWAALQAGQSQQSVARHMAKGGREVWLQATYNPILDPSGRPFKVVKFATDITAEGTTNARLRPLLSQASPKRKDSFSDGAEEAGKVSMLPVSGTSIFNQTRSAGRLS